MKQRSGAKSAKRLARICDFDSFEFCQLGKYSFETEDFNAAVLLLKLRIFRTKAALLSRSKVNFF